MKEREGQSGIGIERFEQKWIFSRKNVWRISDWIGDGYLDKVNSIYFIFSPISFDILWTSHEKLRIRMKLN